MGKFKKSTIHNMKLIDTGSLYDRFIDKNFWLVRIHSIVDFEYFRPMLEPLYSDEGRKAYDCIENFEKLTIRKGVPAFFSDLPQEN